MNDDTAKPTGKDQDRESYLRWQDIALTQLGYTINLMLTLAGAALALAAKTMMESKAVLPYPAHCLFHASVVALAISVFVAVAANVTRALDFRYTRQAARARMKDGEEHDELHNIADVLGTWTWRLFYTQAATFAFGVSAFALSLWCGYSNRI